MTRENWTFQILHAWVELAESDFPPADSRRKGEDNSFWGVVGVTCWGKDTELNTNYEDIRSRKFTGPIFTSGLQKGLYTLKVTLLFKNTTKNLGKIQGLSVLSLSHRDMFLVFA